MVTRPISALCHTLATAAVTATLAAAADTTLVLTRDGRPVATILTAPDATRAAQFAAHELQWHVEQITGAVVPIRTDPGSAAGVRILVGESDQTRALGLTTEGLGPQEYLIRFLPDTLVLMGRDKDDRGAVLYDPTPSPEALQTWPSIWEPQGTMHAVYEFLQRWCDVRWFNPTETGMDCPQRPTLIVTGDELRRSPFFSYRFAVYVSPENYDWYTGLWLPDSEGFKRWEAAAFENLHRRFPDWWGYVHAKRGWVQLFRYRMREGGQRCVGNHSLYGYYKRFWEPDPAMPEVFVERKPDWFAQGYAGTPPQMCYTSPGLVEQVAQDARDYFDGRGINPHTLQPITDLNDVWGEDFFCVEPMDNDAFCKCPRCQQWLGTRDADSPFFSNGRHSDYFFQFVNAVAREVRKTHPDKWILTLAYMTHAAHPERVILEPNVAVQFCFACNRLNFDRPSYEHEIRLLREWREKEPTRPLYLWLYYTFPQEIAKNGGFHCFPGFFAHAVGEQFDLFRELGLKGMFHCGYGQDVEAYITYRLMDDPSLRVDDLLEEYFTRLYGAAAGPMKEMYSTIERIYSDPANYPEAIATGRIEGHHHQTEEVAWGYLGTGSRMARLGELMQQAKDLAATDLERKRVALFEMAVWDYMVEGRKLYMERTRTRFGASGPALRVPYCSATRPMGDPAKLGTAETVALVGWRSRLAEPTRRKLQARLANDGRFLYVRLRENIAVTTLRDSEDVTSGDHWELLFTDRPGGVLRQLTVGPSGRSMSWELGADGAAVWDSGATVTCDHSASDRWVVTVALPLEKLLPGGLERGGRLFANLARRCPGSEDEPVWVPTFGDWHAPTAVRGLILDGPETVPAQLPSVDELTKLRATDLVAMWPLDEGAGEVATDRGPHGLHGKLINGAGWTADDGRPVLHLEDSRRQWVEIDNPPQVNLSGPLTLEAWVKYEPSDVWYPAIMGKGYEQTGTYSLHIRPGLTLWFEIDSEDGTRHHYNPTDLCLTPGDWCHVVATYDGTTMRVFLNGREAGTGLQVTTTIRRTPEPLRIGWLGSYGHFNGCVRDVVLYSRGMSQAEAYAHFLAGMR